MIIVYMIYIYMIYYKIIHYYYKGEEKSPIFGKKCISRDSQHFCGAVTRMPTCIQWVNKLKEIGAASKGSFKEVKYFNYSYDKVNLKIRIYLIWILSSPLWFAQGSVRLNYIYFEEFNKAFKLFLVLVLKFLEVLGLLCYHRTYRE